MSVVSLSLHAGALAGVVASVVSSRSTLCSTSLQYRSRYGRTNWCVSSCFTDGRSVGRRCSSAATSALSESE